MQASTSSIPLFRSGQEKRTEVVFDKDNSISRIFWNIYPNTLDYDIDAISNPDQIPDLIGFTTDSSYFRIGLQVELPLYGKHPTIPPTRNTRSTCLNWMTSVLQS